MKENEKYRNTANARFALKHIKEEFQIVHDSEAYFQAVRYVVCTTCAMCVGPPIAFIRSSSLLFDITVTWLWRQNCWPLFSTPTLLS